MKPVHRSFAYAICLVMFLLVEDARPKAGATAAGRYAEPTLFDGVGRSRQAAGIFLERTTARISWPKNESHGWAGRRRIPKFFCTVPTQQKI